MLFIKIKNFLHFENLSRYCEIKFHLFGLSADILIHIFDYLTNAI